MSPFVIGNSNNPPLNNVNGSFVNTDNSHVGGIPFSSSTIPNGPHTMAPAGGKVDGAAGIYPCAQGQKGGKRRKINRNKINKISMKYKMRGSKRTLKRRVRRMKSRVRSRYSRRANRRSHRRHRTMRGGAFQPPQTTPNYSPGYSQFNNNNGGLSNTYSLGGKLSAGSSALANPPTLHKVMGEPDNLKHSTLNAYGNIGAGSGFPSRGWF